MGKKYYMKAETGIYRKPDPEPKTPVVMVQVPRDRLDYLEECKRMYLEIERELNKTEVPSGDSKGAWTASRRVSWMAQMWKEAKEDVRWLREKLDKHGGWEKVTITRDDIGTVDVSQLSGDE